MNAVTKHNHLCDAAGRPALAAAMILAAALAAAAEGFSADLQVSPSPAGANVFGAMDFGWKNGMRSGLRASRRVGSSVEDLFSDDPESLLASKDSILAVQLDAIALRVLGDALELELGAAYRSERLVERGNFEDSGGTLHAYDNNLAINTLGPRLGAAYALSFPYSGNLSLSLGVIPAFYYAYAQTMTIKPLVALAGSSEQSRWGAPRIDASLRVGAFNLVEIGADYGFAAMPFDSMTLNATGDGFEESSGRILTHEYRLSLEFLLGLVEGADLRVGLVLENDWAVDQETGEPTEGSIPEPELGLILGIKVK